MPSEPDICEAPWTAEQCAKLNAFQGCNWVHPFTCGTKEKHGGDDSDVLIATKRGWLCPSCDYVQNWAHSFMLDGAPTDPLASYRPDGVGGEDVTAIAKLICDGTREFGMDNPGCCDKPDAPCSADNCAFVTIAEHILGASGARFGPTSRHSVRPTPTLARPSCGTSERAGIGTPGTG